MRQTTMAKEATIERKWYVVDATGFEPVKWQIQSLLPYRLAIPQQQFILYIYFRRCKEKNDKNSYKICAKPYRLHAYR